MKGRLGTFVPCEESLEIAPAFSEKSDKGLIVREGIQVMRGFTKQEFLRPAGGEVRGRSGIIGGRENCWYLDRRRVGRAEHTTVLMEERDKKSKWRGEKDKNGQEGRGRLLGNLRTSREKWAWGNRVKGRA